MNYENLKATIAANIYQNNRGEVAAEMVKTAINSVVDALIAGGYLYKGVAHPGDAAETPDANVFYLATEVGTYTNKGGLQVTDGEVAVLKYNGSWTKEVTGAATAAQVAALGQKVDVYNDFINVEENGFFVIDSENNIGLSVTPNGVNGIFGELARRSCIRKKRVYENSEFSPSASLVGTLSSTSSNSRQGGVNVKNIFFQFHDTNDHIGVYDLADLSTITTIQTNDGSPDYHCNDVTLGEYLNEGDRFPLFYVSMQALRQINVYHISNDYVCTKIQTITLNEASAVNGWYDKEAGQIWWATSANNISRATAPSLAHSNVTISAEENYSIPGASFSYGFQGVLVNFGYHLVLFGVDNSNSIQLIDMLTKRIIYTRSINIPPEPETMAYYRDILFVIAINGNVYKVE